jgi:carbon-monoxide dehydrogenase medium subunit
MRLASAVIRLARSATATIPGRGQKQCLRHDPGRAAVKPAPFDYRAPTSVPETVELLAEYGEEAKVLAGGQSLLPLMALRLARPGLLVDIGGVAELRQSAVNGTVELGAGIRQRSLERDPQMAEHCPLLAAALPLIAHPPIRNRGTIGGSLAHGDPAAELPTVAVALDAELVAIGVRGSRPIAAADFFLGHFTTALAPDELLVQVRFPSRSPNTGAAFDEISRRHGDFALVGCAAVVTLAGDGTIADVRLVFSGVASTPQRTVEAEAVLIGARPGAEAWAAAAAEVSRVLRPTADLHASAAYRRHVGGVLAARALDSAAAMASSPPRPAGSR